MVSRLHRKRIGKAISEKAQRSEKRSLAEQYDCGRKTITMSWRGGASESKTTVT